MPLDLFTVRFGGKPLQSADSHISFKLVKRNLHTSLDTSPFILLDPTSKIMIKMKGGWKIE